MINELEDPHVTSRQRKTPASVLRLAGVAFRAIDEARLFVAEV